MFLDIECTSTKADVGQIVAIGIIKDKKKEVRFIGSLEEEKEALSWLKKELEGCDLLISWYGSKFDIPFILSRAVINGVELSELLRINSLDLCELCKKQFLFSKNSLSEVAKTLNIAKTDEIGGREILKMYLKAICGDKRAREMIVKHCMSDLETLEKIFKKLEPYLNLTTKNP